MADLDKFLKGKADKPVVSKRKTDKPAVSIDCKATFKHKPREVEQISQGTKKGCLALKQEVHINRIEDNEALNGAHIRVFAVSATAAVVSWLIGTAEGGLGYPLAVLLTGAAAKSVYNSGENVWNSVKNRSETISTVASDPQRFNELVEELSKINKGMKKHYGIQDTLGGLDKGVEIYKSKGILRLDARGGNEGFLYKDVNGKYNIVYIGNRMKEERQLNSSYPIGELLHGPEVQAYKPVFHIEGDSLASVLNGFKEVTENTTDLEKLSKFSDVVYKQEIEAMESAMKSANVKPYK